MATKPKIVFFETNQQDQATLSQLLLKNNITADEVMYFNDALKPENLPLINNAEVLSVFIRSAVDQAVIDSLPNLKLINTSSTGFDHVDAAYARQKGIKVSNVPAYGSRTVAEFTFALMLGLSRKAFLAYRQVKDTHNYNISAFEGFNLQGKTLGVVGTGRIGQNVIQIAKGFEMNVLGFDAFPNQELATKIEFAYVSLDNLLSQSDVITLHVPYNKGTHHIINKQNIKNIKPGAILINTSRGEVADTEALLEAVNSKLISGLGLDVIEGEKMLGDETHAMSDEHQEHLKTLLEDHILIDRPEVAYTPHIAFFSREAKDEILQTTAANISAFLQNNPQNLV